MMRKLFICHAGAGLPAEEQDDMGIVGMAYVWAGEWLRSPEWAEGRERNPVMKLRPLFGPEVDVWGDVGCFTAAEYVLTLEEEN
ncbi:hypothetical protein CC205_16355 [Pseudomonas savastanoi pv. nerii]|uniref:Uncharacterized protein n=1 Tax=Pseudomonas savastanoi pv. nerii TaxID=360921 RepID=A0AB73QZ08_PSESS|nr:hypothetical protein [Pseudomonas savastanoi]PAB31425.1 hypothetical protein CC205_16355 [Pseudomonas savastanoi pv. nerii]PAB37635.1 hypothetical protein CC202_01545 [Pseudomonas savastanoi]